MQVKQRINLHIYPSPLTNESRIEKEVRSLIDLKLVDEVVFLGYESLGKPSREMVYPGVTFIRIKLYSKNSSLKIFRYLMFIEFFFKALYLSFRLKYDIINLHSLHVLPIGIFIKTFRQKKVIYDAHELETEVNGSKGLLRIFSKIIERISIKFVDYVIVVSTNISEWYKRSYSIDNITVIRNVPNATQTSSQNDIFRHLFSIPKDHIIFIYQGLLNKSRGVNIILETFSQINQRNKHIIFLGDGPMKKEIQDLSQNVHNIHFHSLVEVNELPKYTSSADVGIHMILNTCLNHYYCLPNKIFEYFLYGIPVIVSDFPEMKMVVDQNNIGWCISPDILSLKKIIEELDLNKIISSTNNVLNKRANYSWEKEALAYIKVFSKLGLKVL